ncbi:MAG: ice-binding family protein [Paludibacter sp.]|nr:ice-binding family protein [Paludibacter sp.]
MKREKKIVLTTLGTILILLISGFTSLEIARLKPIEIPVQKILLEPVALASAQNFAVLAGSSINNSGKTIINGEIGLSPGLWVGGLSQDVIFSTHQTNSIKSLQAKLDLTTAYNDAEARRSEEVVNLHGNIGGLTLTPGLYNSRSSLVISKGDLIFDALGKPNAVFIIQIATILTTRPETRVILKGGAMASNIFWQVGETAIFGSNSVFKGTVMALKSIKFYNGATLEGRGLSRGGEVNLASNIIQK